MTTAGDRRRLMLLLAVLLGAVARASSSSSSALESEAPALSSPAAPVSLSHAELCARGSSGADTFVDYEFAVACTPLAQSRALALAVLALTLGALLYLQSSTADAFFSPALQVLVEQYRIPPDVAGVTFLSFGNGSPDVFANIAAFSSATPNIGVASILGGGLLVTTGGLYDV